MGLFEWVFVDDERFVCSERHALSGSEFQSKDFGCRMGYVNIDHGVMTLTDGGCSLGTPEPDAPTVLVYTSCRQCPAFVQRGTGNLVDCSVEFELILEGSAVMGVKRTSLPTAEWLATEPTNEWMAGCEGPMPWQDAQDLHCRYDELRPGLRAEHREAMRAKWGGM